MDLIVTYPIDDFAFSDPVVTTEAVVHEGDFVVPTYDYLVHTNEADLGDSVVAVEVSADKGDLGDSIVPPDQGDLGDFTPPADDVDLGNSDVLGDSAVPID